MREVMLRSTPKDHCSTGVVEIRTDTVAAGVGFAPRGIRLKYAAYTAVPVAFVRTPTLKIVPAFTTGAEVATFKKNIVVGGS